jgi:AcrR family transcriptional regulator
VNPRERRAARHRTPEPAGDAGRRRAPITVEQVVDTALAVVAAEGYEALTMRRLATELGTGPASLYSHVVNKADLDELLIGRLCAELVLPEPDPATWREQIRSVCAQLRDLYLRYPGISRAALAMAPTDPEVMRVEEGMLAILLAGGLAPQTAAWGIDALSLYVAGYCLENSIVRQRAVHADAAWVLDRDELVRRFAALPADVFPFTTRYATELNAGEGHDRFDFAMGLMIDGLRPGLGTSSCVAAPMAE